MKIRNILLFLAIIFLCASGLKAETMTTNTVNEMPAGKKATIHTSLGDIKVLLYDETPGHRDNFIKVAKDGVYDGTLFHRVIKDFMVQAGDPDSRTAAPGAQLGAGDLGYTQPAEIKFPKFYHKYGALSAARTGDNVNPERRSSASQFYIVTGKKYTPAQLEMMQQRMADQERQPYFRNLCVKNKEEISRLQAANDREGLETLRQKLIKETEANVGVSEYPENIKQDYTTIGGTPHLDGQYTVFGEVLEGMDVVEKIQQAETDGRDRPVEDIRILSVEVE
ncbi:MAG: peptidylprolyl isomerase [Muribaculaceae bacterium]|nr:peptidylprolyl isomerase [Muribaculaceae bacterium]